MIKDLSITVQSEDEKNSAVIKSLLIKEIKKQVSFDELKKISNWQSNFTPVFIKKSVDARHGQLKLHLRYKVFIGEKPTEEDKAGGALPVWKKVTEKSKTVIIVGAGPAGLFGALKLLERGYKPVIIERGCETSQRRKDIALISTKADVNANSNYCFGEGGAGTFSDGKLYTRSNKRGDIGKILRIFVHFGADPKILTDAHPHIGTDKLPKVINNMRSKIIELGGEFHFNQQVVEFVTTGKNVVTGVIARNTVSEQMTTFNGSAILLATGHSATDIYQLIAKTAPAALEAKTFAAGVRVEHPRILIDAIQYHGKLNNNLGAAEYRVTTQVEERGVYSFCMCPGGFVVPSASGPDEIVVNGMSAAARNSKWSNAAIVVEIRPEDVPEKFKKQAAELGCPQIAGLLFRTEMEKLAKKNGDGQAAPAQRLKDFLDNKKSTDLPESSYTPGLVSSNLNTWMPKHISQRLAQGFRDINRNMKGFICDDALMIAMETRTSTPVRIARDKETFECIGLKNVFPAGEGSGYSGGIVSSAMDGENACEKI